MNIGETSTKGSHRKKGVRTMPRIRSFAVGAAMAVAILTALAPEAPAKPVVDRDSLVPPPPAGADCRAAGQRVICHTGVIEPERINEPLLDLPCGTLYESSTDVRRGIRWYDASSHTIVKRFVSFDLEGTWSLSPSGEGPVAEVSGRATSLDVVFPDPEDPDTWPTVFRGVGFTVQARGVGVIAHVGRSEGYDPDDYAHGVGTTLADPDVASALCDALGG